MNVKPEYIRKLNLPETDEEFKTLPVEKRLFLVWAVNPTYASDQVTHQYTSLAAAVEAWTAYTVPDFYHFQMQAISVSSDDPADELQSISVTINGNNQPISLEVSGGAIHKYQYAMPLPMLHMKPGDTVEVQYLFDALGHTVTTKIIGWLYEVALDE